MPAAASEPTITKACAPPGCPRARRRSCPRCTSPRPARSRAPRRSCPPPPRQRLDERQPVRGGVTARVPTFCHGRFATVSRTWSRPRWWRAAAAATTWPTWGGSNVPPKIPIPTSLRTLAQCTRGRPPARPGRPRRPVGVAGLARKRRRPRWPRAAGARPSAAHASPRPDHPPAAVTPRHPPRSPAAPLRPRSHPHRAGRRPSPVSGLGQGIWVVTNVTDRLRNNWR